ncbi:MULTISPECIES: hypothetical protein [Halolamina]|uniref:Rhomboid family protein n=1 Tax=Halolamina pelagica TaxID=699431 RepID=A0A1I5P2N9_9EURY|nr:MULTISPECIES: hypothetical protein [Halolamina]NHX36598.1 hypothetical protein [Halolamina sp. R1-12]SFP28302.1 hypothetical protein SAMN05216277_102317 [Halolamina pelagica]
MVRPGDRSFTAALRDAVRLRDCLALSVVPALALATFALPAERRESLAFAYRDPSILTAYTAHVVHFEPGHLAANLLGYVLVTGFAYVLAGLADYRRLFGITAATFLVAFPPVLSGLNLAVPRNAVGYGLSGVNMAFSGLLALVLVAYGARLDRRIRVRDAPAVFFAAIVAISVVALPSGTARGVGVASVVLAAVYVIAARRSPRGDPPVNVQAGWLDAGVLGAVALLGYQYVGFSTVTADGGVVNVYLHLLGFCLGFIVPYSAVVAGVVDGAADRGFLSD